MSQSASDTRLSQNIDCVSAYAIEVGAYSWEKQGEFCTTFAKCAA